MPEEVFVAPGEMLAQLRGKFPATFQGIELPRPIPEKADASATAEGQTPEPTPALTEERSDPAFHLANRCRTTTA